MGMAATTKLIRIASGALLALAIAPLQLSAQSQSATLVTSATSASAASAASQPPIRVEVASIRLNKGGGDEPSNRKVLPGGRFVATATTVRTLIRVAFGTDDNRISGLPSWVDNETYDIDATTANHAEVSNPQQFQQLLLSLLEDRFQLKFHREQKEGPVYWLVLDKLGKFGPALKPSVPATEQSMSTNSNGAKSVMRVSQMSMADIAAGLRRQAGRPVEDHTGLQGNFDFQIEWAPEETADSNDASLFTVLKERLGLKLQPAKGVTEMRAGYRPDCASLR